MLRFLLPVCLLFATAACNHEHEPTVESLPVPSDSSYLALDSLMNFIANNQLINGNVLIYKKGEVYYQRCFGKRNLAGSPDLEISDRFNINSLNKQLTAVLVLMLVDEGICALDDPIEFHIPGFPYQGVKVRHLLSHTSGIPGIYRQMAKFDNGYWNKLDTVNYGHIIEFLAQFTPEANFNPGTGWEYSNTNYYILKYLLEQWTGKRVHELYNERIFEPLGISPTMPVEQHSVLGHEFNFATAEYDSGYNSIGYHFLESRPFEEEQIYLSVEDYVSWHEALRDHTLLSAQQLKIAISPAILANGDSSNYGFGWFIDADSTLGQRHSHTGFGYGFFSNLIRYPEHDIMLVMLINQINNVDPILNKSIENAALGRPFDLPKASLAEWFRLHLHTYSEDALLDSLESKLNKEPELLYHEPQFLKIAQGLCNHGQESFGRTLFTEVLNRSNRPAYVHNYMGEVYLANDWFDLASQHFRTCFELDSNYTNARENYLRLQAVKP